MARLTGLKHICFAAASVFVLSVLEAQAKDATIKVRVYGEHVGGNVVYHYAITNNGERAFNNILIGSVYDQSMRDMVPQLNELPVGSEFGQEGETGTAIVLSESSTNQPTGWVSSVYGQQGIDGYYLSWHIPTENILGGTTPIKPGQTLSGFTVSVPRADEAYLRGGFRVRFGEASQDVTGMLEIVDKTAPKLSLGLTPTAPWPPNGKPASIVATISTQDDYDSAPGVRLESIVSNEALTVGDITGAEYGTEDRRFALAAKRDGTSKTGRTYTVTYSATDASGNKSVASATVTVPHDQGTK